MCSLGNLFDMMLWTFLQSFLTKLLPDFVNRKACNVSIRHILRGKTQNDQSQNGKHRHIELDAIQRES